MSAPEVLVHERRPRWRPELERQFRGEPARVRSCSSLGDLAKAVDAADPPPLVVLDLDAAPAESLQLLGRWTGRPGRPAVVAITGPRTADLEWPARELGALTVLPESISCDDLANVCRRQWAPRQTVKRLLGAPT